MLANPDVSLPSIDGRLANPKLHIPVQGKMFKDVQRKNDKKWWISEEEVFQHGEYGRNETDHTCKDAHEQVTW